MEESEKRRERLKAMRAEAAEAGVHSGTEHSVPSHGLSNPLIEASTTPLAPADPYASPRFDYYTDPMSAFAANKRKQVNHPAQQQNYCTPPRPNYPDMHMYPSPSPSPSPFHQPQMNHCRSSSDIMGSPFGTPQSTPRVWQGSGGILSRFYPPDSSRGGNFSSPVRAPGANPRSPSDIMGSPFGTPQSTPHVWQGSGGIRSHFYPPDSSRGGNFSSPVHAPGANPRSPSDIMGSPFGTPQSTPPVWQGSSGIRSQFFPPDSSRGGNFSSPVRAPGANPRFSSVQGSGPRFSYSPGPSSGRGHRRGSGSRDGVSAETSPELFYRKSMVEDPWKWLKPIVLKKEKNIYSNEGIPKSIGTEKARALDYSKRPSSQPSLAECLAASFNEATNDES